MATLTSSSNVSSSKLFGTQRRRTYRSDYGSYSSYESCSSKLEKSFPSRKYTTSNGPSIQLDSYSISYLNSRRGESVDRQTYYRPSARRSSTSVDRDLALHTKKTDLLFGASSVSSREAFNDADYETARSPRRRYSVSVDSETDRKIVTPLFPTTRRRFTDIIDKQAERREREREDKKAHEEELRRRRDENIRGIITKTISGDEGYSGFDYRTMLDGIPKRNRSSSISYTDRASMMADSSSGISRRSRDTLTSSSASVRSRSIARSYLNDAADDYTSLRPRRRSSSVSHYDDTHMSQFAADKMDRAFKSQDYEMSSKESYDKVGFQRDISSYVLDPKKPFNPDSIKVTMLPSGKRATTYTENRQYGTDADSAEANAELEKVIQKTKIMQESMHTLENFVRANRSLFPPETCVYQQIRFFQLSREQLVKIGESPDAVLYGVKIRERLVVPHGTDVTDILSRYYGNKQGYEIEYSAPKRIKQETEEEIGQGHMDRSKVIRKQVEEDFEKRDTQRILGTYGFETRQASRAQELYERYKHIHPHITDSYMKSFYVNAGLSFAYKPQQTSRHDTYYYGYDQADNYVRESRRNRMRRAASEDKYLWKDLHALDKDIEYEPDTKPRRYGYGTGASNYTPRRGLDYDSIYDISRSQRSNASLVSDLESVYSARSSSAPSAAERRAKQNRLDAAPQFTSALRPKRTSEGCTVRFNCSVTAVPMPDVVWLRSNNTLEEGGRIHISNNFGLLSLEISNVRREDAGVYTVRVSNKDGEAVCSASLEVDDVKKHEPTADGERKPWFILEAQNQWCEVGQRVTFEAQATGRPIPSFNWLRDNHSLTDDSRVRMYSDEQGNAKLVIRDLKHGDSGLYFCVAESKAGKAKCAATLKVVDKGQLGNRRRSASRSRDNTPLRRRSMSRDTTPVAPVCKYGSRESTPTGHHAEAKVSGTAPWFLQTLATQLDVHEGEPIELKCIVDGDPKPRVTWLKEPYRELMYSKRHRVVCAGDHHFMCIKSSIQNDAGRFIVVAENDLGKIQSSCFVNMLPPRVYEGEDFDVKCSLVEMPEYEYEIETTKERGKMAPRFIKKLPVSKEVKEGDDISVECKIDEGDAGETLTGVHIKSKVVKEGAIKTITVEKSGHVKVEKDVFVDRDKTPTKESFDGVAKAEPSETVEVFAKSILTEQPPPTTQDSPVQEEEITSEVSERAPKAPPLPPTLEAEPQEAERDLPGEIIESTVSEELKIEMERLKSLTPVKEDAIEPVKNDDKSKAALEEKVEAMTVAGIAPVEKAETEVKPTGIDAEQLGETVVVAGVAPQTEAQQKETEQVSEVTTEASGEKMVVAGIEPSSQSSVEVKEEKQSVTSVENIQEKSTVSSFTSKQKLQFMGSSTESTDSSSSAGVKIKVKTKSQSSEIAMSVSKSDETTLTMASVKLQNGHGTERGILRRTSSKDLYLKWPVEQGGEMTVAGIEPKTDKESSDVPDTTEKSDEKSTEGLTFETEQAKDATNKSEDITKEALKVAEPKEEIKSAVQVMSDAQDGLAKEESVESLKESVVVSEEVTKTEESGTSATEEAKEDVTTVESKEEIVSSTSVATESAATGGMEAQLTEASASKESSADAKEVDLQKLDASLESQIQDVSMLEQTEGKDGVTDEVSPCSEVMSMQNVSEFASSMAETVIKTSQVEVAGGKTEVRVVVKMKSSETSDAGKECSLSPATAISKGESRSQSVVSEDPTESSWTEYTSEATLSASDADTEIDDVVVVKKSTKVTKVTRKVMEVGADGEEREVSSVTEVTTKVTEDGETKVTHERSKEVTGGDSASESSSSESSSDESSSDDESSSSSESVYSTVEIGKGEAVNADVAKDDAESVSSEGSSSEESESSKHKESAKSESESFESESESEDSEDDSDTSSEEE